MLVISLPSSFGYVGLAATGALWLNFYQMLSVAGARKVAKIAYPQLYADKAEQAASKDAYKFNCVQRSHQNLLEVLPSFLTALFFGGLKHPKAASILGGIWVVARLAYHVGYSSGEPKNRVPGGIAATLSSISLYGIATWTAISMLQQSKWEF